MRPPKQTKPKEEMNMTKIQIDAEIYADVKAGVMTKTAIAKKYNTSTRSVGRAVERHEKRMAETFTQPVVKPVVEIDVQEVVEPVVKQTDKEIIYIRKTSNDDLKVGDVVMLTDGSNWPETEANPRFVEGVVSDTDELSWLEVKWPDNWYNLYKKSDNDLILLERDGKIVKDPDEKPRHVAEEDKVEVESPKTSLMDTLKSGNRVEYVLTGDSVILTMGNETEIVDSTHPNYKAIREAIFKEDFKVAFDLMNIRKAIESFTQGNITIKGDKLFYGEMHVKTELADKIIQMMQTGDEGFKRLIKFFENLMKNPSRSSVEQLWGFVCHNDVEIDEDGFLIGWKKVRSNGNDLVDSRTGKVPNNVGCVVEMPRWMVDDRREVTCSQGLHVGAWDYVRSFSGNVITKVRMNPADVVSVPDDYDDMKVRTSKYEVIGLVDDYRKEIPNTYEYKRQHVMVGSAGEILGIKEIQ